MSTDETAPIPERAPNGWTKLFHPRGPQVTLPVPCEEDDPRVAFDFITACLDVGWLVEAPGLEAGEEKDQVGWVVRGSFEGDRGTTPFLLLYSVQDQMTYSFLKVYLNDEKAIADFEFASKLKFAGIPEYDGNDKPERGASGKLDRYFIKPSKPFGVVFKPNPKYDANAKAAAAAKGEVYKVPRRLFVRWADTRPAEAEQPKTEQRSPDMVKVGEWKAWLQLEDTNCAAINKRLPELSKMDAWTKSAVWHEIKSGADAAGWTFSQATKEFTPPNNQTFAETGF